MEKLNFQTSDGVSLYVEILGESFKENNGQPLILWCHGFTGSARNWRSSIRHLPGACHIIYDQRGHARSGAPEEPEAYRYARLAQDAIEILEFFKSEYDLKQNKIYMAGLSLGSMVTYKVLELKPELLDGAILSSMPDPLEKNSTCGRAAIFSQSILEEGMEIAGSKYVWGGVTRFSEKDAALVRQGFLEHSSHGMAYILRETLMHLPASEYMAKKLTQFNKPVLILAGIDDDNALHFSGRILGCLIDQNTQIKYVTLPGGHLLNLTSNALFCKYVKPIFVK